MRRVHRRGLIGLGTVSGILTASATAQIAISTVPIGNPGNVADASTGSVYGSVQYIYDIGTTEVTNAQYTAFLNAVAAADPNELYHEQMAEQFGGILRTGIPGAYHYSTIAGRETNPVNWVSFWDAARFANWLHNGQPVGTQNNGTTDDGAYTLTPGQIAANSVVRNAGWKWAVTNENEWYKAAYFQPAGNGGDADSYWLYPHGGNILSNQGNFKGNSDGTPMSVASFSPNFYGTYDMGGNLWEWNETVFFDGNRGHRGGAFSSWGWLLRADFSQHSVGWGCDWDVGFRVVAYPSRAWCTADTNHDGQVDLTDFFQFLTEFDQSQAGADINADGSVDLADFFGFLSALDQGC